MSRTRCALFVVWLLAAPQTLLAAPLPRELLAQLPQEVMAHLQGGSVEGEALLQKERLLRFYEQRGYHAGWLEQEGVVAGASELLSVVEQAQREGLPPGRYHQPAIRRLMGQPTIDAALLARLDILLSDTFLAYSSDVRSGRFKPHDVDDSWHIAPPNYYLERLLRYGLESRSVLATLHSMPPYQGGYRRLRRALYDHRQIAAQGGWPQLPDGPALQRGMTGERVALLRRRLLLGGDLLDRSTPESELQLFDAALEMALERFQQRHGLAADGVMGESTRAALNVPVETRIRQLQANMERWRWLPRHSDGRYLMVNMTGYLLEVIEEDKSVMQMRVIIGSDYRQTPVFDSEVTELVFNPSWYVPPVVFRKDLLPQLKRDGSYLQRHNMMVLADLQSGGRVVDPETIDWGLYDTERFPYVLRQEPGAGNPLGLVKFVIPNSHGIYLHDTSQPNLFARRERTFSSGCIRLEKPLALASYLLKHEPGMEEGDLSSYLSRQRPAKVKLTKRWPVYLLYWTAWVDEEGVVQFREDVYNRDVRLIVQMPASDNTVVSQNQQVQ